MPAIPERLSLFKRSGIYDVLYFSHGKRPWKSSGVGTRLPESDPSISEECIIMIAVMLRWSNSRLSFWVDLALHGSSCEMRGS
jgi:hypothetical protein